MPFLSRDQILGAKPATKEVEVPAWGGSVRVKALSISDRLALLDDYKANMQAVADYEEDQKRPAKERKKLPKVEAFDQAILQLIHAIVDDNDKRLFTTADHAAFKALDYNAVQHLLAAYLALNNAPSPTDTKKN